MLLGRTWLGIALAAWFGIAAEVAVCGALIAPATIPRVLTALAGVFGALAWVVAQGLWVSRIRFLSDPHLADELAIVRRMAEQCLASGDLDGAHAALSVAMAMDDTDVATRVLWARLMTARGNRSRARRAWRMASRLDLRREYGEEIRQALERLA